MQGALPTDRLEYLVIDNPICICGPLGRDKDHHKITCTCGYSHVLVFYLVLEKMYLAKYIIELMTT